MKKKKKIKKRKSESTPTLTEQEKELLESILGNLKQINKDNVRDKISGPVFAQALVERLPLHAPEIPELILTIREAYDHKNVRKAIKKTIFRLKQEGVQIEEPSPQKDSTSIFGRFEKEDPTAYLSPIDGTGSRGVLVILPQIPKGVDVGIGAVSYENGIVNFIANSSSKKQAKEIKDFFFGQAGKSVETSLSHAATILEVAYKKNQTTSTQGIEGYLQIRPKILDNATLLESPIIYDFINPEELSGQTLTDIQVRKFLDHELMGIWIISPDKIRSLFEEVSGAENSPILISEDQKASRIKEIKERAILDIYTESRQLELKNMLEEMAYVFLKLNEDDYARLALTASLSLEGEDARPRINPFLNALLAQSLKFYGDRVNIGDKSMEEKDASQANIIIP